MHESPPYQRGNFAYIDPPGPFESGLPAVYYVSPPDPKWSKAEQAAYVPSAADLLFTSVHEVWPGHFLQFLHSNRVPSVVGRIFIGYAFALWPLSIWYGRSWSATIRGTIDGLVYGLLTGGTFGWLWPH